MIVTRRSVAIAGGLTALAFLALGERVLSFVGQFHPASYLGGVAVTTVILVVLVMLGFSERLDI